MKRFLRILSLTLCLSVLLTILPPLKSWANTDSGTVTASGICGDNLTWELYSDGTLEISGNGSLYDYTCESMGPGDDDAWADLSLRNARASLDTKELAPWPSFYVERIIMHEGVTSIGSYAFYYCKSLVNVSIPDSVTSIGSSAFFDCINLTDLTIPGSVTMIGDSAFYSCDGLVSLMVPGSVTEISNSAFRHCDNLIDVTILAGVVTIGTDAFYSCDSLVSVSIPNSVTGIEAGAFEDCISLTDVYYTGTQAQWDAISIGTYNERLTGATIHLADTPEGGVDTPEGGVDTPEGGNVTDSGTCGDNLTWKLYSDGTLEISGTGSMYDYNYFDPWVDPWEDLSRRNVRSTSRPTRQVPWPRSDIKRIVIYQGVTHIGSGAFQDCASVRAVYFCGDAPSIGHVAFDVGNNWVGIPVYYHDGAAGWVSGGSFITGDFTSFSIQKLHIFVSNTPMTITIPVPPTEQNGQFVCPAAYCTSERWRALRHIDVPMFRTTMPPVPQMALKPASVSFAALWIP